MDVFTSKKSSIHGENVFGNTCTLDSVCFCWSDCLKGGTIFNNKNVDRLDLGK